MSKESKILNKQFIILKIITLKKTIKKDQDTLFIM